MFNREALGLDGPVLRPTRCGGCDIHSPTCGDPDYCCAACPAQIGMASAEAGRHRRAVAEAECPKCSARIGEQCFDSEGWTLFRVHPERLAEVLNAQP